MIKKFVGAAVAFAIFASMPVLPAYAEKDARVIDSFNNMRMHSVTDLEGNKNNAKISYSGTAVTMSAATVAENTYEELAGIFPTVPKKAEIKYTQLSFEQTVLTSNTALELVFRGEADTVALEMLEDGGKLAVRLANAYPDKIVTSADFSDKNKIDLIFEQSTYPVDRAFLYLYVNNEFICEGIAESPDASTPSDIVLKAKKTVGTGIMTVIWDSRTVTLYNDNITPDGFREDFAAKHGDNVCWLDSGAKGGENSFTVYGKAKALADDASATCIVTLYDKDGNLLDADIEKYYGTDYDIETKVFQKDYDGRVPDAANMLIYDGEKSAQNSMTVPKSFDSTPIYILSWGNSFALDPQSKLRNIAKADGINLVPYAAHAAGRPLNAHYDSWNQEKADYQVRPGGSYLTKNKVSMKEYLNMYDWDYVTLQGTTHYNAYDQGLFGDDAEVIWATLTDAVRENAPDAKRLVHATWTPISELCTRVNDGMFTDGEPDPSGAYLKALLERFKLGAGIYSTETDESGEKAFIPTLVAVDYLVRHYGFSEYGGELDEVSTYDNSEDTLCVYRDKTCHLTDNVGRVLAGLVWYEMITGIPATESNYTRSTLSSENMQKIKEAAHYACENYMTYDPSNIE